MQDVHLLQDMFRLPDEVSGKFVCRHMMQTGEAVKLEEDYAGSIPFFQAEREIDAIDIQQK